MIRPATEKDIAQIQTLYRELFEGLEALQPHYIQAYDQDVSFFQDAIQAENKLLLVVELDNEVVAFALAFLKNTLASDCLVCHKYVYLADLAVSSSCRRLGLGKKLLNAVKEWGRSHGAHFIELDVLEENELAQQLYERENFTVFSKAMRSIL